LRIFLDENVPRQIAQVLTGHDVASVWSERLEGVSNGQLLRRIAGRHDDFITSDGDILSQSHLAALTFSVIVLPTNHLRVLLGSADAIRRTIAEIGGRPGLVAVTISWKGIRHVIDLSRPSDPPVRLDDVAPFG
jgi:hypothetical protein